MFVILTKYAFSKGNKCTLQDDSAFSRPPNGGAGKDNLI